MTGVSEGVMELHREGICHGDLKPESILCFSTGDSNSGRGTLVVAHVGLAKFIFDPTGQLNVRTETPYLPGRYEPPEVMTFPDEKRVRLKYHMWGLGCIFLEFVIWMLYGQSGLTEFYSQLTENTGFWIYHGTKDIQTHSAVRNWIQKSRVDAKCSLALSDLVELTDKKLLVLRAKRADSITLVQDLSRIRRKCSSRPSYLFDSSLIERAEHRTGPSDAASSSGGYQESGIASDDTPTLSTRETQTSRPTTITVPDSLNQALENDADTVYTSRELPPSRADKYISEVAVSLFQQCELDRLPTSSRVCCRPSPSCSDFRQMSHFTCSL
ncbi:hypothetical protein V1506DRAFT_99891 [Lipomyces tetrasporus]